MQLEFFFKFSLLIEHIKFFLVSRWMFLVQPLKQIRTFRMLIIVIFRGLLRLLRVSLFPGLPHLFFQSIKYFQPFQGHFFGYLFFSITLRIIFFEPELFTSVRVPHTSLVLYFFIFASIFIPVFPTTSSILLLDLRLFPW